MAFNNLRHVSITAGSGILQPPRQYEFDLQRNALVSVIDMLPVEPYRLLARYWVPPPWNELKTKLQDIPRKEDHDFDVAANLRVIIGILVRSSE
jgi:hypothetical protein